MAMEELLQDCTLLSEATVAALGQRIHPPPSPAFGGYPTAGEKARFLEAMQPG